jgi:3D (Asp-Asp-Asp) domain-containing protein
MTQLLAKADVEASKPYEMPVVLVEEKAEPVVDVRPPPEPAWQSFEATAYIALCDTGCTGITKTGIDVRENVRYKGKRIIAVDPSVIPLGSAVEIRLADGTIIEATAQDTGGAIRGKRLDLLVSSESIARNFGRQIVKIRRTN